MTRRTLPLLALLPALAGCASLNADPAAEPARVVFFAGESSTLDAPARGVVLAAAEAARRYSAVRVNVFGYAGPAGGAAFNRALSEARAQHVAELLRQAGQIDGPQLLGQLAGLAGGEAAGKRLLVRLRRPAQSQHQGRLPEAWTVMR